MILYISNSRRNCVSCVDIDDLGSYYIDEDSVGDLNYVLGMNDSLETLKNCSSQTILDKMEVY